MDWDKVSKEMSIRNWVTLLLLGLGGYCFADSAFTLGIIFGGLTIIANFNVLQHTICRAFGPDNVMRGKKKSIIAKYYLRLIALGVIFYILVANSWVDPVGLIVGLSTVVISIVSIGIHRVIKSSNWETI